MAFKIQPFYGGSPLQSSSPDRDLGPRDLERKQNRLERVQKRKEKAGNSEKKNKRLSRREIILQDQIDRKKNGISEAADKKLTPLYMVDKKLDDMMKQKADLEKKIADIKAKAAKENKIGNWDEASDQLSRLNERIEEHKSKNPK